MTTIQIKIRNLNAFRQACEYLGLEFKENQKTYKWYGRFMNDSVLDKSINVSDLGKCTHAASVKGNKSAYELGLIQQEDGYQLIADNWLGGYGLHEIIGNDYSKIMNVYTNIVTKQEARKFANLNNYTMTEEYDTTTQETVLKLRRY